MADSDNSTALPSVTRRRLMAGTAAASVAWASGITAPENASNRLQEDSSLRLCEKWRETHVRTLALCRSQQLLESQLVKTLGFPALQMAFADDELTTKSAEEVVGLLERDAVQDQSAANLAAHQARWDAMDDQLGYSRMDGAIRQSEAAEQAILSDLQQTPATTIHGVLAKLSVILCEAEYRGDPVDFPWPHIHALRNDLVRLHGLDITQNSWSFARRFDG